MTAAILSQDVEPASPAAVGGLQPYTDYIVGSDQILQEVGLVFLHVVLSLCLLCLCVRIYNPNCMHIERMGVLVLDFVRLTFKMFNG